MITEALEKGFLIGFTILGAGIVAIGVPVALLVLLALLGNARGSNGGDDINIK